MGLHQHFDGRVHEHAESVVGMPHDHDGDGVICGIAHVLAGAPSAGTYNATAPTYPGQFAATAAHTLTLVDVTDQGRTIPAHALTAERVLAKRGLALLRRVVRGYDWTAAEVDAFEAACRDAGIQ